MFVLVCGAPSEGFQRLVCQVAFCGEVGNWNWLEESGGAPLNLLSSGEIFPCF